MAPYLEWMYFDRGSWADVGVEAEYINGKLIRQKHG